MPTSAHGRADVGAASARPWTDVGIAIDNYTGNGIGNVIQTCRAVHVM